MAVSSKHASAHCGVVRWLDERPKWNDDAKRDAFCTKLSYQSNDRFGPTPLSAASRIPCQWRQGIVQSGDGLLFMVLQIPPTGHFHRSSICASSMILCSLGEAHFMRWTSKNRVTQILPTCLYIQTQHERLRLGPFRGNPPRERASSAQYLALHAGGRLNAAEHGKKLGWSKTV